MIKKIIIASNNVHILKEFKEIFAPYSIEILSLKDLDILCNPEENGKTFLDNAFIKAKEIAKYTALPILSDDSGIEVHALNGFPGVYSSRFMEGHSNIEKNAALLKMVKYKQDKSANYKTVICMLNVENKPLFFEGVVDGNLVEPIGENGFGYDPIFYSIELNKTFGEALEEEKNKVSHRGKAASKVLNYLLEKGHIK